MFRFIVNMNRLKTMRTFSSIASMGSRWKAAGNLVDAYNSLPPTYSHENDPVGPTTPDPVTSESTKRALDNVNKAEAELEAARKK